MWLRPSVLLARHHFAAMAREPEPLLIFFVVPLGLIAFLQPVLRLVVVQEGLAGASGAEHAVPGIATTFAASLVAYVAVSILEDRDWGTWERLRAAPISSAQLLLGKVLPWFSLGVAQFAFLFTVGALVLDLRVRGSLAAVALVAVAEVACLTALGLLVVTLCRAAQQASAFGFVAVVLLGGTAGGLTPVTMLPEWVQTAARANPSFWAVRALKDVVTSGAGVADVLPSVGVIALFAAGFLVVALLRMERGELFRRSA